jgi:hypothetical protein
MQHLLQLNLQQLPSLAQQELRLRRGLLQVFVCVTLPCCQPHHPHKLRQDIQVQVVSMKPPGSARVLDAQPVRDLSRAPTTQLLAATGLPIGEVPRLISVRELASSSHADPLALPSLLTTSSPAQSRPSDVDAELDQIGSLRSEPEVPSSSSRSAPQSQPVDSMGQPLRRVICRFSYQVIGLQPTSAAATKTKSAARHPAEREQPLRALRSLAPLRRASQRRRCALTSVANAEQHDKPKPPAASLISQR